MAQKPAKHPSLTFILGGARSGKSDYALERARALAGDAPVLFIATAGAGDAEMNERIAQHRAERPDYWQTLEAPLRVGPALLDYLAQTPPPAPAVLLLDCLSLLVSNVLFAEGRSGEDEPMAQIQARLDAEIDALLDAAHSANRPLLVVSNEVGMGIVPLGRVSRNYRDLLGRANRRVAGAAGEAIFVVAGVPLDLTALRATPAMPLLSP